MNGKEVWSIKYIVIKPFRDISGFKQVGDTVELDNNRAAKLRRMGLIGGRYQPPVQTATKKPTETRAGKKKSTTKKSKKK